MKQMDVKQLFIAQQMNAPFSQGVMLMRLWMMQISQHALEQ